MKAKATALLLADLGVTKSHSRPHTSNDNPFSESHFKTLKYHVWTARGVQVGSAESDGWFECGHVSGLLARHDDRWPRWVPRATSKQLERHVIACHWY
jgi:transposase InsO family protein